MLDAFICLCGIQDYSGAILRAYRSNLSFSLESSCARSAFTKLDEDHRTSLRLVLSERPVWPYSAFGFFCTVHLVLRQHLAAPLPRILQ